MPVLSLNGHHVHRPVKGISGIMCALQNVMYLSVLHVTLLHLIQSVPQLVKGISGTTSVLLSAMFLSAQLATLHLKILSVHPPVREISGTTSVPQSAMYPSVLLAIPPLQLLFAPPLVKETSGTTSVPLSAVFLNVLHVHLPHVLPVARETSRTMYADLSAMYQSVPPAPLLSILATSLLLLTPSLLLQMTTFHLKVLLDSVHLRRHLEGTLVVTVTTTVITTTTQGLRVVTAGLEARLELKSLPPDPVLDPHEFPSSRELTLLPSPPPLTGMCSSRLGSSPTDPVADSGHLVLVRHSQHWSFSVRQWTTMLLYCLLSLCHVHSAIMYTVHYAAVY